MTVHSEGTPAGPRRILCVVRPAAGGIRQHVLTLLEHIDRSRFVLSLAAPQDFLLSLPPQAVPDSHPLAIAPRFSLIRDLAAARFLERLALSAEIVHAQGLRAAWVTALAHLRRPFPFIVTAHNLVGGSGPPARLGLRLIGQRASRIIAVSDAIAHGLTSQGVPSSRIIVIPNGVDLERFGHLPEREAVRSLWAIGSPAFVVGCIGRLSPEKGIDVLIRAAAQLPGNVFLVAGDGPERARLEAMLPPNVRLLGRVDDARTLLAAVDVLAIPSRQEGQGIVALEGMAAGVPLVASRVGGLAEMLTDGETAHLVPPDDAAALADALSRLKADPDLRRCLAVRARKLVKEKYDLPRMLRAVEGVYETVLR